jgi:hypothetical protein
MEHPARTDLRDWLSALPTNFFEAAALLQCSLRMYWGDERMTALRPRLSEFGHVCATTIDAAARLNDRIGNHPQLDPYTGIGEHTAAVAFHPSLATSCFRARCSICCATMAKWATPARSPAPPG